MDKKLQDFQDFTKETENLDLFQYPWALNICEDNIIYIKTVISNLSRFLEKIEDRHAVLITGETEEVDGYYGDSKRIKKKFTSQAARDREIRRRCNLELKYKEWTVLKIKNEEDLGLWKGYYNRLRRQLRILEHEYMTHGIRVFNFYGEITRKYSGYSGE